LGLFKQSPFWTDVEVETLKKWYRWHASKKVNLPAIAKVLDRTLNAVGLKAEELGLTNIYRKGGKGRRKYFNEKERKIGSAKAHKEWLETHEHPRGALGMKHTPETKAKMKAAAAAWMKNATPEQLKAKGRKMVATKLERYGSAGGHQGNPYSSARRGKRADLGDIFFRSRWEANYARYLNFLKAQNQIKDWQFEPQTFIFHGVIRGANTYLPDFKVIENDGSHVWHEVKGWMKSTDRTKLKRMAKYYPDEKVIVIGPPEYAEIESSVAGLIDKWEYKENKHWVNW